MRGSSRSTRVARRSSRMALELSRVAVASLTRAAEDHGGNRRESSHDSTFCEGLEIVVVRVDRPLPRRISYFQVHRAKGAWAASDKRAPMEDSYRAERDIDAARRA